MTAGGPAQLFALAMAELAGANKRRARYLRGQRHACIKLARRMRKLALK
jgi:hypothetical protein